MVGASSQQCFMPTYASNSNHSPNEMCVLAPSDGIALTTATSSLLTPVSLPLFHGTVFLTSRSLETHISLHQPVPGDFALKPFQAIQTLLSGTLFSLHILPQEPFGSSVFTSVTVALVLVNLSGLYFSQEKR